MKKIKLTTLQEKNLKEAAAGVLSLQNQMRIIQTQLNSAANYRRGILEMICESNKMDLKELEQSNLDIKNGCLVITPAKASDRIRQAIKQTPKNKIKSNGHGNKIKA